MGFASALCLTSGRPYPNSPGKNDRATQRAPWVSKIKFRIPRTAVSNGRGMARKSKARRERDFVGAAKDLVDELAKRREHDLKLALLPDKIVVHDDTFIRTIWYVQFEEGADILAWMYRSPGQPWNVAWRFRYPGEKIELHRICVPPEPPEAELVAVEEKLSEVFQTSCDAEKRAGRFAEYDRLDIQLIGAEALACIEDQPWAKNPIIL